VLVGALAQVQRGQVEAEHLHRAHQRRQARADQRLRVVRCSALDHLQVGQEGLGIGIGSCGATAWRSASVPVSACSVAARRAYMPISARR
jgi:hypothetical protein